MKSLDLHYLLTCLRQPALRPLFRIPSHLTSREKVTLNRLARARERSVGRAIQVVEIGAYLGASSAFFAAGLSLPGSRVHCIDTWTNDAMTEGRRDTLADFQANTARFGARIVPVRGWSHDPEVLSQVRANAAEIDVLFIDGDHSHEGALADWLNYSPMLAPGATVVLHDVGWAEGVQRIIAERVRSEVVRERRLPNLWWGQWR